jgi:hypothetical protein
MCVGGGANEFKKKTLYETETSLYETLAVPNFSYGSQTRKLTAKDEVESVNMSF